MTLPSSHFQIYITVLKISKIRIQVSYFFTVWKSLECFIGFSLEATFVKLIRMLKFHLTKLIKKTFVCNNELKLWNQIRILFNIQTQLYQKSKSSVITNSRPKYIKYGPYFCLKCSLYYMNVHGYSKVTALTSKYRLSHDVRYKRVWLKLYQSIIN